VGMTSGKPVRLAIAQTLCRALPPIVAQRLRSLIYPRALGYEDDYPFVVRAQTGSLFTNRTSDFHAYAFSVHGYFEWRNWAIAVALCRPGDTIVEIGANIGTETIGFSDIVGDSGKVYAFEPVPSNLAALHETLLLAKRQNVVVLPFAVGDRETKVLFSLPQKMASGEGHILRSGTNTSSKTIQVDCVTLDSLSERIGAAEMIFIDAEGAEVMILRGAKIYINEYRPAIVLEASPKLLKRAGSDLNDLCSLLQAYGYSGFRVSRLGLAKIDLAKASSASNWFWVHSSNLDAARVVQRSIRICGLMPCIPGLNPISRKRISAS